MNTKLMDRPNIINSELLDLILREGNYEKFQYAGFTCFVKRHIHSQTKMIETGEGLIYWSGFIRTGFKVPPDLINTINVHGGITYNRYGLVGFDCAHASDLVTVVAQRYPQQLYRCKEYVKNETKRLADQLKKISLQCKIYTTVYNLLK